MSNFLTTDVVSIYQLKRTGNTESYNSTPAFTNVNCCLSPTNADIQTDYGGVYSFQIFELFIWDTTVTLNNGDKVVSQSGTSYLVTGSPNVYSNRYIQALRTLVKVII